MFWRDCLSQKNSTWIRSFLYYQERRYFFSLENTIVFFRRKMKNDFSQRIHGNMIFSVYSKKMYFFFLQTLYYSSIKKAKLIFSWKKALKDKTYDIIEKHDIHSRKHGISSDRRKKVPMIFCIFMETFVGFFRILLYNGKKQQEHWDIGLKLSYMIRHIL